MTAPVLTEQQDRVMRLLIAGKTQVDIAKTLRLSRYRVRELVRRVCDLHGVDYGWELAEARASGPVDEMPDDGRIRVDGTDAEV